MLAQNKNSKKILIIEDDSFISEMYSMKFKSYGWQTFTAENGQIGLEKIHQIMPDLILLDIIMPQMDGFETLRSLRKDEVFKNTPVIILSNLGEKSDIEKGLSLGANDYIVKAYFTPQEVVKKIEKYLTVKNQH